MGPKLEPMIFDLLKKSFSDLLIPAVMKIMIFCVIGYMLGWVVLTWIIIEIGSQYAGVSGMLSLPVHLFGSIVGGMVAWFFLPLFYPILISFFVGSISESIEREDYPQLPKSNPPFWPTFWQDAWFSVKAIAINILCLPIYLVPLVGLVVYYTVNGYLLGKQFFWMAAGRHVSHGEADILLRKGRNTVFIAGVTMMVCATLPLIGLVAPVLGVALMLHLFHQLNGTGKAIIIEPSP